MKKIPKFKTEADESKFWDEHSFTDFIGDLEEVHIEFPKPKKRTIPILLDEVKIQTIKQLASAKDI
ncbi:MAG: CopG family antitoxin [Elusimicrobiota bacterium]